MDSERVRELMVGGSVSVQHSRDSTACPENHRPADFQEQGRDTLGFPCFLPELQQTPLKPAPTVSLTGCLCHLLLPKPSQITPTEPGGPQFPPMHPEEPTGSAASQQHHLCPPSMAFMTQTPWDHKVEEGPLQQHIPVFPRGGRD